MNEHPVESMVNMMAAIEADMMVHRYGFYGAFQQIDHIEKFHMTSLQSETLKTFEKRFWERVRIFIEIKHPESLSPSKQNEEELSFDDWDFENFEI